MPLHFRNSVRPPVAICLGALFAGTVIFSTACAEGSTAVTVKMTVTAHDNDAVRAVSQQLAAQGQAIALAIATKSANLDAGNDINASTTYSVSTTRTGTLTETEVQGIQAQCRHYAARPGMRCTIESTYGTL